MTRRKQSELPKNDFAPEEDHDIVSFTSEPIVTGECISSFSFDDDYINETALITNNQNTNNIDTSPTTITNTVDFNISSTHEQNIKTPASSNNKNTLNNTTISNNENTSNKNNILEDNRKVHTVNGMAPPVDGEFLDVKRTYLLRSSTVRKLNELKSIHPDLNTYVSTLVDLAIAHYYEHIVNEGDTK